MNSSNTTIIFIILCALLGNTLYYQLNNDLNTQMPTLQSTPVEQPIEEMIEASPQLANIASFEEIAQRPLFEKSRQPVAEIESPKAPVNAGKRSDFKLEGIVISEHDRLALIRYKKQPQPQRVKLDEYIEGWKLTQLANNQVILEHNKKSMTLPLERKLTTIKKPGKKTPVPNTKKTQKITLKKNFPARNAASKKPAPPEDDIDNDD